MCESRKIKYLVISLLDLMKELTFTNSMVLRYKFHTFLPVLNCDHSNKNYIENKGKLFEKLILVLWGKYSVYHFIKVLAFLFSSSYKFFFKSLTQSVHNLLMIYTFWKPTNFKEKFFEVSRSLS